MAAHESRPRPALLLALALLPLGGCYEEPVDERLIVCLGTGEIVATARCTLLHAEPDMPNVALRRRLDAARTAYLEGSDLLARTFAGLSPTGELLLLERDRGALVRVVRSATFEEPDALGRLFGDLGSFARLDVDDGWAMLELVPGTAGRASAEQRRTVEQALKTWSATLARYLGATAALYEHLQQAPGATDACFAGLFGHLAGPDGDERAARMTGRERELVAAVRDARDEALSILELNEEEAMTLDELSRLVHDPFPVRVSFWLPAAATDVEGFVAGNAREVAVPARSLWDAFASLEGRWLEPDPMVAYVRAVRGPDAPGLDFAELVSRPRWSRAATADEIEAALIAFLRSAPTYRARFRLPATAEGEIPAGLVSLGCPVPAASCVPAAP